MKNMKLEWKRGDWAAYFGLMTNNLTNLLTMMGLLIFVVGIPKEIVYGRIAPAFGLAVLVASLCYTWFGLQMARATGRTDVTALPSGPSAPSIFTVTFLVLMPVYQQTGDADFAIQIGLVWCFVEAMILAGGSFLGETIRKMIPRTVLLSCLSGLGLLLLAMNPMLQAFEAPTVSFIVLLLIFINWFGKKPIFARIPTGLLLLIAGTLLAWISGLQSPDAIKASMSSFGFNPPEVHVDSFMQGLPHALPYLASAVPLGLANYIFDLENIESAHAAGDEYPTRKVMLANGLASMLGCLMGNPFPVTVYVGHPGWKAMGASIGYTLASGVTMFIVPLFGLGAFMLAIIPMTAIVPILVFIGVVTANQVVRETPKVEVPVIFICLFPWIANWALTMMNSVMSAAGTSAAKIGTDVLHSKGIYYEGLMHLGNGAPLASMLWGCIAIFAILNKPLRGAVAAAGGALLALFGVIHETGHARYEQNLPRAWAGQPVALARSTAIHESQSLFFEMQLGRSDAFLKHLLPAVHARFGSQAAFSEENFIAWNQRVKPGYIRVDADEVSYPAHVVLRYEIERALINGEIEVDDIPALWDEKMQAWLGLSTKDNYRNGCMQDIHWTDGGFGYFPSYTLGAMYAAQLFHAAKTALPGLQASIAGGDFSALFDWLRQNIWQHGSRFSTSQLITQATGEDLNIRYFREHLTSRYL